MLLGISNGIMSNPIGVSDGRAFASIGAPAERDHPKRPTLRGSGCSQSYGPYPAQFAELTGQPGCRRRFSMVSRFWSNETRISISASNRSTETRNLHFPNSPDFVFATRLAGFLARLAFGAAWLQLTAIVNSGLSRARPSFPGRLAAPARPNFLHAIKPRRYFEAPVSATFSSARTFCLNSYLAI